MRTQFGMQAKKYRCRPVSGPLLAPYLTGKGQPAHEEVLGMTRRNKVLPTRKQPDRFSDDDSLLMRSAESLGRVIGALQRQLDSATKRLTHSSGNGEARAVRSTSADASRARVAVHDVGALSDDAISTHAPNAACGAQE